MADLTRRDLIRLGTGLCVTLGTSRMLVGCGNGGEGGACDGCRPAATVHTVLGDTLSDLYQMGRQAAQSLGINAGFDLSGRSVFIKPNLIRLGVGIPFAPESGDCTKGEILVAVAQQCLEAGARKVVIGDGGQAIDWDWSSLTFFEGSTVFGKTNLREAVDWLRTEHPLQEIELACLNKLDQWERIPSCSENEIMQEGLPIGRSFFEADHVISVPVLKTHFIADVTLSMKNFVGVTSALPPFGNSVLRLGVHQAYEDAISAGFEKAGIEACFLDVLKWRKEAGKQDFAIIDGSIGVEENGPATFVGMGKTIDIKQRSPAGKYFLLASNDLAAADATAARIMNHDVDEMKQLLMARKLGLGEIHNIRVVGDAKIEDLIIPDFERVEQGSQWDVSATMPQSVGQHVSRRESHRANVLGSLALSAGMICLLKRSRIGSERRPE